jgi:hypothetical protein
MARFSVHVHALLILGCWITFSSGAVPLSLEGKLHELEVRLKTNANEQDKINILLVNKVNELEEKVKQLETQLEQHVRLTIHLVVVYYMRIHFVRNF